MERENQVANVEENEEESISTTNSNKQSFATTLHQSSVVRWLSLILLLQNIKNAHSSLLIILRRINQAHRVHNINVDIVEKLIAFLETWDAVVCELPTGDSSSLFLVLPHINLLREKLQQCAKREEGGHIKRLVIHR